MNATMRGQLALSVCANISFRVSFILIVKDQAVFRGVVIGPAASSGPAFCAQVFTSKVDGPIHWGNINQTMHVAMPHPISVDNARLTHCSVPCVTTL
jgi:hypothetical protein